ncbi:MAG: AraC family ligand binding domain-containing protein [Elusimicrobiales bacterium]|jgi:mannose-6-phosphate isomerase-like protein (cupin superfamily)|nr:AraC family ligand binding domain-containing protein [Elusimicrobiales bacterium]
MPQFIEKPKLVKAAGNKPKIIEEFIGRANSGTTTISVARMVSPGGWEEPEQHPLFTEYTLVLKGLLRVETRDGTLDVRAGQAIIMQPEERVRYSTPEPEGAEYIAICLPAFSFETVRREGETEKPY